MRRAAIVLGGAVLAVILAASLPVAADRFGQPDPNDVRGLLDVEVVRFDHDRGPPTWRFVMFSGWGVGEIWDRGYLIVELDTRGDAGVDYVAVVSSNGRRLIGTLLRLRSDGREVEIASVAAEKDRPGSAVVSVALRKLTIGRARTTYRWAAVTSFTSDACRRTCLDRIPDEGTVEQPLPGVTPTPTPTPSPTP